MKKLYLIVIGILLITAGKSQTASPYLICTAGDSFDTTDCMIDWSVGECVTETHIAGDYIITQGFHQDYYITNLPPADPKMPTGSNIFCNNEINSPFSIPSVMYANTYKWELSPAEAGSITGTSNSCSVNWSDSFSGETKIRVQGINHLGAGNWSPYFSITINDSPKKQDVIGTASPCLYQEPEKYNINTAENSTFLWQVTNGSLISGENTEQIIINWDNNSGEAIITVTETFTKNSCYTSNTKNVTVLSNPTPTNIVLKGDKLLISKDSGFVYQWYYNNEPIPDAKRQFYYNEFEKQGDYQVLITYKNKCSNKSEIYTYKLDLENQELSKTINLYPNPSTGIFTIEIDNDYICDIQYSIKSYAGKTFETETIYKENIFYSEQQNIQNFKPGLYLLEFIFEGNRKAVKILVIR